MDLGIRGRTALIAGGSAGMGRGTAEALAGEGVRLFISARGEDRLRATCADIAARHGVEVTPIPGDHSTPEGRAALLAACPDPDILMITIAPPGMTRDFRDIGPDDWLDSVKLGLVGPIEIIKQHVDGMFARRWGRIVNIATVSAKYPVEARLLSGPARSALANWTGAVSKRLARHNVTINNLLPGMFRTETVEATLAQMQADQGITAEAALEQFCKRWRIPAQRIGEAADIGTLAAWLCSEHASYIVGQNIVVDGGGGNSLF